MNQRNSLFGLLVCCCALTFTAMSYADDEATPVQGDPVAKSPIGLNTPFTIVGPSAQAHEPKIPVAGKLPPPVESSEASVVSTPVVDPEAIPLPRADGSGTASNSAATAAGGGAWWSSPEAKVVGFLIVLIIGAWVVGRVGQRGGTRPSKLTGGGRPSGVVQVLARFPIGRGDQLMLLECGQRILLLEQQKGRVGNGLKTLTEFTTPEDVADLRARLEASNRPSDESFQKDLERSIGMYTNSGAPVKFVGNPVNDADSMETVDLTRRRPRRAARGPE